MCTRPAGEHRRARNVRAPGSSRATGSGRPHGAAPTKGTDRWLSCRGGYHPPGVSSPGNAARRGQAPALRGVRIPFRGARRPRRARPAGEYGASRMPRPTGAILRDHIHPRPGGRPHGAAPTKGTDRWLSCRGGYHPPGVSSPGNAARWGQAPALRGAGSIPWGATTRRARPALLPALRATRVKEGLILSDCPPDSQTPARGEVLSIEKKAARRAAFFYALIPFAGHSAGPWPRTSGGRPRPSGRARRSAPRRARRRRRRR